MKKIIVFLFIFTLLLLNNKDKKDVLIPNNSIRFRIIANSNNLKDQELKNKIKLDIEPVINEVLNKSNNIAEVRDNIKQVIPQMRRIINEYNTDYNINYGYNYFPEKIYKNVTYKAGEYESLVITLGSGMGDNWWCVLFPPLCLLEAKEEEKDDINYSFYIKEIIDKYY